MDESPATRSTPRVRRDEAGGKRPDGHKVPGLRHRPDPRRIRTAPTHDLLTGAAGLLAFGVFLRALGVDAALHAAFDHLKSGPRMVYLMGDVLRMLVDLLVVGEVRVYGMEAWAADPLFVRPGPAHELLREIANREADLPWPSFPWAAWWVRAPVR